MKVFDLSNQLRQFTKLRTTTEYIVIHHAAALYRQNTGIEDVMAVYKFHTDAPPKGRGWSSIGYNWALAEETNGGPIALYKLGRPDLERAHVMGQNYRSFGISCLTNFTEDPEDKWLDALAQAVYEAKNMYPSAKIVGHKDITIPGFATTCPGPTWNRWKFDLFERVNALQKDKTEMDMNPQVIGVAPRISKDKWMQILQRHSAQLSLAEQERCYTLCTSLDIDPAFVVALWLRESGSPLGGSVLQQQTHCPINIKAASDEWRPTVSYNGAKWLSFETFQLGLMHSMIHLKNVHGWSGRLHVRDILEAHAPRSENDTDSLIKTLLIDWNYMQK